MEQLGDAVATPPGAPASGGAEGSEAAAGEGASSFVELGNGEEGTSEEQAEATGEEVPMAKGVEQVGQQLAEIKAQAASSGLIAGGSEEAEVVESKEEEGVASREGDEAEVEAEARVEVPSLSAVGVPDGSALEGAEISLGEEEPVVEDSAVAVAPAESGAVESETSGGEEEASVPAGPSLRERLKAYVEWATEKSGAKRILLGDAQGYCLYDGASTEPQVLAAAVMLAKSWQQCLRHLKLKEPGPVTVGLGHGYRMMVVPCETRYGLLTLSLISNGPYDDEVTVELRRRLLEVIEARA